MNTRMTTFHYSLFFFLALLTAHISNFQCFASRLTRWNGSGIIISDLAQDYPRSSPFIYAILPGLVTLARCISITATRMPVSKAALSAVSECAVDAHGLVL